MQKKTIALLMLAALLINIISPLYTHASDDKLTDMFQEFGFYVNNTEPGAYTAQSRGFISGGGLSARSRYKEITWGSVTPPSLRAGCGGLDIFFGGVSFLNLQAYVDMLKSIGQNALGYAFELGLEAVCPTCNSVLKFLQNKANELNKFNTDSCNAAKYLVNNILPVNEMAQSAIQRCESQLTWSGLYDENTAHQKCITDNAEMGKIYEKSREGKQDDKKNEDGVPGIATLNALRKFGAAERALALNLLGTYVHKGPEDEGKTPGVIYVAPTINFKDIMYGKPNAKIWYPKTIDNPTYAGLGNSEIDSLGDPIFYTNIPNPIVKSLFDNYLKDGGFVGTVKLQMEGILANLNANTPLTAEQKQFIDASVVPILNILDSTRHMDGVPGAIMDSYAGIIAGNMIEELINGYAREAITNSNKQDQVKDEMFIDRIETVKNDVHKDLVKTVQHYEAMFKSYEINKFFFDQLSYRVSTQLAKAITSAGGQK